MVNCPECGSEELLKKGFRNNKQRYQCKTCGRHFIEGTKFVGRQVKLPTLVKTCPYCKSNEVIRDGRLEDGSSRFQCKTCGKNFSTKTFMRPPVGYKCPYCGGKLNRSGKGKLGQPEFHCTECGKSCSGIPPKKNIQFSQINKEIYCPYCNSLDIKLRGNYKGKNRMYSCKSCGRRFSDTTYKSLEEKKKKLENHITCKFCGSARLISAGISPCGTQRLRCRDCKKTFTFYNKLTEKDKKLIAFYRVNFKVPYSSIIRQYKCSKEEIIKLEEEYKKNLVGNK